VATAQVPANTGTEGGVIPPPANANDGGILSVRSLDQIRQAAEAQVGLEIEGAKAPLQDQIGTLQGRETNALQGIDQLFNSILPFVGQSAARVSEGYQQAEAMQKSIFDQANVRLNDLKGQRAGEAQALAQQMGGPVAIGEFTDAVTPDQTLLANTGATQQLHTLGYAQAGTQEAEAFAGRVMPLVKTEQSARARQFYEEQISDIQQQITALEASKSSRVNAASNEMMIAERQFALNKAQEELAKINADRDFELQRRAATRDERRLDDEETQLRQNHDIQIKQLRLDQLKASRDWKATLRTLGNEDTRVAMAQAQLGLSEGQLTGTYKGKPTIGKQSLDLQAKQLAASEKRQARALGISDKEYALRKQQLEQATKFDNAKLAAAKRQTWSQYLDIAINPQPGKAVTTTVAIPVPKLAAQSGKTKDAYADKSSPTGFSKLVKTTTVPPTQGPITEPGALVDYLSSHGVPRAIAVTMVKQRLRLPSDWTYGEADPRTPTGPYAGRH
jgi:hypothetical protein